MYCICPDWTWLMEQTHNISMGMVLLNQCLRYLQYWPNDCIKSVTFEFRTGVTLRMLFSGMWYHAFCQKCAIVLDKYASILLMVEEDTMDIEAMCSLKTSVSFFLYTLYHVLENSIFSTDNFINYVTVPIVVYIS